MKKQFTPMLRKDKVEDLSGPSMTRPDSVVPLEQLLNHRQKGIPIPYFNGVFSEEDTPDIQKMDFLEIAQLREDTAAGIEAAKEDYHALTKQMEELKKPKAPEPVKEAEKPPKTDDSPKQ